MKKTKNETQKEKENISLKLEDYIVNFIKNSYLNDEFKRESLIGMKNLLKTWKKSSIK